MPKIQISILAALLFGSLFALIPETTSAQFRPRFTLPQRPNFGPRFTQPPVNFQPTPFSRYGQPLRPGQTPFAQPAPGFNPNQNPYLRPNQNPYLRPYQRPNFQPGYQPQPGFQPQPNQPTANRGYSPRIPGQNPNQPTPKPRTPTLVKKPAVSLNPTPKKKAKPKKYSIYPRMVGEFEPQRAIMLSVSDLQEHHSHVLAKIVKESAGYADILILYNTNEQLKETVKLLNKSGIDSLDHVSFYKMKLDTVWLRDFGPRISEDEDGARAVDFFYHGVRPFDDSFPERWAKNTSGKLTKVPWTLQGGNLISNGQGVAIASSRIFDDNKVSFGSTSRGPDNEAKEFVAREIKELCNLKELVILEPLRNESTKHVDMFAAFLAPDRVLVAAVDPRVDNLNARVLDWNAKRLAAVKVNGKPMQVERIQIPARDAQAWSTYTNAIFTERLVLMPTFDTDSKQLVAKAVAKYKKLLPNHHIATVDITSMKKLQGSLHCMSLNLPSFAPLPEGVVSFAKAQRIASQMPETVASDRNKKKDNPHSIDKQLRKIFQSSNGEHLVDAYAVAADADTITLLRAESQRVIRVRVSSLCEADKLWVQRNVKKIREKGAYVRQFVKTNRGRLE